MIYYYFDHNARDFRFAQRFLPRCKQDYIKIAKNALTSFKKNKEPFKLLQRAHLEYIYLDYLNKAFAVSEDIEYPNASVYAPYLYAGMLFNVSMAWLGNDCRESIDDIAEMIVNAIYFEKL